MEEDLILGEPEKQTELDIIDNQLIVINSLSDVDDNVYDDFQSDKIKVFVNCMKIILSAQRNILKNLK